MVGVAAGRKLLAIDGCVWKGTGLGASHVLSVNLGLCTAPRPWRADLLTDAQSPLGHTEGTQIVPKANGF